MRPFRVLALDGGGMRGLYSATVLDSFAKHFATRRKVSALDVGKGFDLIVGTSTGGIIACGLAAGLSPAKLIELFRSVGPRLFSRPIPDTPLRLAKWVLGSLMRAANSDESLRDALEKELGDETLEGVYARRQIALCIPSVNIATAQSIVFKTPHFENLTRDRRWRLRDICLSTSAAPIYLPLAAICDPDDPGREMILADGGLWANNPVLIGLIEALLRVHRPGIGVCGGGKQVQPRSMCRWNHGRGDTTTWRRSLRTPCERRGGTVTSSGCRIRHRPRSKPGMSASIEPRQTPFEFSSSWVGAIVTWRPADPTGLRACH